MANIFNPYARPLYVMSKPAGAHCNLACDYCYYLEKAHLYDEKSARHNLTDELLEKFIKQYIGSQTMHEVLFTWHGGEPLMRKDLAEVGAALKQRGYPWGMVTNGLALTEKRFKELMAAGLRSIAISFDGLELDHNWLRQHPLAFEGATRAIKLAAQYGVQRGSTVVQHSSKLSNTEREALNNIEQAPAPAEQPSALVWDVVTCVNQRTINQLDEMQQYLWSIGVRNWRLITIDPMGRAAENPELILTPEQHRQVLDYIREKRKEGLHISYSCEGFMPEYEMEIRDHLFHCAAGISIASILIDGSISACTSVRGNYAQGNIYRDRFINIFECICFTSRKNICRKFFELDRFVHLI